MMDQNLNNGFQQNLDVLQYQCRKAGGGVNRHARLGIGRTTVELLILSASYYQSSTG